MVRLCCVRFVPTGREIASVCPPPGRTEPLEAGFVRRSGCPAAVGIEAHGGSQMMAVSARVLTATARSGNYMDYERSPRLAPLPRNKI